MSEHFNIVDLFYDSARLNPDKVALIDDNTKITFGNFETQVTATAFYFLKKGIKKGDRVLVFVPMSIDLYRTVLAIFRIGATAVFLDEWVSKKRMEACCEVADCSAFIAGFKISVLSIFSAKLRQIPIHLGLHYDSKLSGQQFPETDKNDTALITFTTGSTGTPKAAKRTHGFLNEQFKALIQIIKPGKSDVSMPVLPIVLLINLGLGITSVITRFKPGKVSALKPETLVRQIRNHQINTVIASPFFIKELSKYLISNQINLGEVTRIFTGGAPVFTHEAAIYINAFPGSKIEIVYGSTEAEPISSIKAEDLILENEGFMGLNVGKTDANTEVKIISITEDPITISNPQGFGKWEMPAGKIGEIVVSGSHVLREYFNNDEALQRNKIFVGDQCWHRTGDSGFIGQNNNIYLTGRCSTLINKEQKIISPFIFEGYFQTLPGVEMGTVQSFLGQIIVVIELNDPSKKQEIKTAIRSIQETFGEIIFLKHIPRDPRHYSKIDYEKLKTLLVKHSLLIRQMVNQ